MFMFHLAFKTKSLSSEIFLNSISTLFCFLPPISNDYQSTRCHHNRIRGQRILALHPTKGKLCVTLLSSYNVTRLWVTNHPGYVNFVGVLKPKTIQVQWPMLLIPVLSRQRWADLLSSRTAWWKPVVPGQSGLHKKTLPQNWGRRDELWGSTVPVTTFLPQKFCYFVLFQTSAHSLSPPPPPPVSPPP